MSSLSWYLNMWTLEVHRLIELALRMGTKLEKILDDNAASFTLAGIAHACSLSCVFLSDVSSSYAFAPWKLLLIVWMCVFSWVLIEALWETSSSLQPQATLGHFGSCENGLWMKGSNYSSSQKRLSIWIRWHHGSFNWLHLGFWAIFKWIWSVSPVLKFLAIWMASLGLVLSQNSCILQGSLSDALCTLVQTDES